MTGAKHPAVLRRLLGDPDDANQNLIPDQFSSGSNITVPTIALAQSLDALLYTLGPTR